MGWKIPTTKSKKVIQLREQSEKVESLLFDVMIQLMLERQTGEKIEQFTNTDFWINTKLP